MGAFFCYQKARRESLIKENAGLNNKQVVAVFCYIIIIETIRGMESFG